ncbi:glycosyltransferase family 2 protein [Haloplanus natans]|uniref:glycosyltransferase family 2 protein n=1 Tax=Haloplanus natans TaxID=376171 RepID=UPI000677BD69|nr:glycosyltransferase family 2 protein [Haloplanus natans]
MADVTVLIPAYNEAGRIGPTVRELIGAYDVLVVDDGSGDETAAEAREAGATVVEQETNRGYMAALTRGFDEADAEVLVTYDADGEHKPAHVSKVITPVCRDRYDLVFGARDEIPRPSERLLNRVTQLALDISDSGSGLRAIRRSLATRLTLETACPCGTLALEAATKGARLGEVQIETRSIRKPRGIAWQHARQLGCVIRHLLTFAASD